MISSIALAVEAATQMLKTTVDLVERRKDLETPGLEVFQIEVISTIGMGLSALIVIDSDYNGIKGYARAASSHEIEKGINYITARKIIKLPTGDLKLQIV